jgi:integrase
MKANIRKRGSVWHLDQQIEGVRHRVSIGEGSKSWAQSRGNELVLKIVREGKAAAGARRSSLLLADLEAPWRGYATEQRSTLKHISSAWSNLCLISSRGLGVEAEAVRLSDLTREAVEKYRFDRIDAAEDECDQDRKERSVYSQWNQAKSVLQSRAVDHYRRKLKMVIPKSVEELREFKLPRPPAWRYVLPPAGLIEATEKAGAALDGDLRMIYRLAMNAGLRSREMAHMSKDWLEEIQPGQWGIAVVTRPDFRPKGSERRIPVPSSLAGDILARDAGPVLSGRTKSDREEMVRYDFSDWMRSIGWDRATWPKAAHELRKLYGSRVYSKLGPAYAQQYLGHASVDTTCRYYAALDAPMLVLEER